MNAEVLQIISIIAFSLSGVFLLIAVILFFRLNIRGVIDDISGRKAERQIKELREQNRQGGENGRVRYQPSVGSDVGESNNLGRSGKVSRITEKLPEVEMETTLLQEEETTVLVEEETTVLVGEETTLIEEEGTTLLEQSRTLLPGGYHLILDEVIIHTKERI